MLFKGLGVAIVTPFTEDGVDLEKLKEAPIEELNRIYVKFHEEAEKEPSLNDEARAHFKNLEDGKEYEVKLWKEFRELSLMVFERVYKELGVEFDSYAGESFYGDKMDEVVDILEDKGIIGPADGAKPREVYLAEENPSYEDPMDDQIKRDKWQM